MNYYDLMITQGWGLALGLAALVTLAVSVSALCVGAVFGVLAAWSKLAGGRTLHIVADTYTTVLRGIPDLLVIYLFYFGGSSALGAIGRLFGYDGFIGLPAFATGAIAVGLISGAYQAEVYRGANLFIAKGELEAARAVGMNRMLLFRRIILPQALRFAIPGLGNCWQMALKESALISVTGLVELLRQSYIAAGSTRRPFDFYITAAILYLAVTWASTYLFQRAERYSMRGLRRTS